jgi:cation diffusion facilitator family transporter
MSGCGCEQMGAVLSDSRHAEERRRVLWIVLGINAALFLGEFSAGWLARSTALQADSLDSLGDASVYALSLFVVTGSIRQKASAALVKGVIQAVFGVAVLVEVIRRAWFGGEPIAPVMALVAALALFANLACFLLLSRFRRDDLNMRSVWLCSRNDLLSNASVIFAAGLVALSGSRWPDLIVGALVAGLFLHTSFDVLRDATRQLRHPALETHAENRRRSAVP